MKCCPLGIALVLLSSLEALAQIGFTTVAVSGQPVPGAPANVNYDNAFFYASINGSSGLTFRAQLITDGFFRHTALFAGSDASPMLIGRVGTQAPDSDAGVTFSSLAWDAKLNESGAVAFLATVSGGGGAQGNQNALFAGAPGSLTAVARTASQADDLPAGITYASLSTPALADDGRVAFNATLSGAGVTAANDSAYFVGMPAALVVLAREGDQVMGVALGVTYGSVSSAYGSNLNDAGALVFSNMLAGTGVTTANDRVVFAGVPGSLLTVAREGDQAAAFPAGVNYGSSLGVAWPSLNDAGQIAFAPTLTGSGATASGPAALVAGAPDALAIVARQGDAAPGTPAGVAFDSFPYLDVALNGSGAIAFAANLAGPGVTPANDSAIYAGRAGELTLIAREGSQAPGLPAGAIFGTVSFPGLNQRGELAFVTGLSGDGVTAANDQALYAFDPGLGMLLIVREGDSFDLGGGNFRTVAGASAIGFIPGTGDNSLSGLGDDGRIAFSLRFTDGSLGLFVARMPAATPLRAITRGVGGEINVTALSAASRNYRLQTNDTLGSGSWQDVATSPGTGSDLTLTHSNPSGPRRFYRVISVAP